MSCTVELQLIEPDKGTRSIYVPLDVIQGRAVVKVKKEIAVTNIQIKLLGQTYTAISKEVMKPNGRMRVERHEESHEVVYDVDTVFPPDDIKRVAKSPEFTLTPGVYIYPFKFQLPLNSVCGDPDSAKIYSNRLNSDIEKLHENTHHKHGITAGRYVTHIVSPLPPSCKGTVNQFSGSEGYGVKYEVKCTVRRASMFKTNIREVRRIILMPFEFGFDGLRSIDFKTQNVVLLKGPGAKRSGFKKIFKGDDTTTGGIERVTLNVDVGFVQNHLVLNTDPIRNLVVNVDGRNGDLSGETDIYLRGLNIILKSQTNFKAQDFNGYDYNTFDVLNLEDLRYRIPLKSSTTAYELDLSLLFKDKRPKIPVVTPSFQTCSIQKGYFLQFLFLFSAERTDSKLFKIEHTTGNVILSSGVPFPPTANININHISNEPISQEIYYNRPSGPPPPENPTTGTAIEAAPAYDTATKRPPPPPALSTISANTVMPSSPSVSSVQPTPSPEIPRLEARPGESEAAREKREVEEWFARNQNLFEQGQGSSTDYYPTIQAKVQPPNQVQTSSVNNTGNWQVQTTGSSTVTNSSIQTPATGENYAPLIDFDSEVVPSSPAITTRPPIPSTVNYISPTIYNGNSTTMNSQAGTSSYDAQQNQQTMVQINQQLGVMGIDSHDNHGEQLPSYEQATNRLRNGRGGR